MTFWKKDSLQCLSEQTAAAPDKYLFKYTAVHSSCDIPVYFIFLRLYQATLKIKKEGETTHLSLCPRLTEHWSTVLDLKHLLHVELKLLSCGCLCPRVPLRSLKNWANPHFSFPLNDSELLHLHRCWLVNDFPPQEIVETPQSVSLV